jgi:hypothetical protein
MPTRAILVSALYLLRRCAISSLGQDGNDLPGVELVYVGQQIPGPVDGPVKFTSKDLALKLQNVIVSLKLE